MTVRMGIVPALCWVTLLCLAAPCAESAARDGEPVPADLPATAPTSATALSDSQTALHATIPTSRGVLHVTGQIAGPTVAFEAQLDSDPGIIQTEITTHSGDTIRELGAYPTVIKVVVRFGELGAIHYDVQTATGDIELRGSSITDCGAIESNPVYQSLSEALDAAPEITVPDQDRWIIDVLTALVLIPPRLLPDCQVALMGSGMWVCVADWKDCYAQCKNAWPTGSIFDPWYNAPIQFACTRLCNLEFLACLLRNFNPIIKLD